MKKFRLSLIIAIYFLLYGCGNTKVVEERNNNYDRWNSSLDSVIEKTIQYANADISVNMIYDYDKFEEIINEYSVVYDEMVDLIKRDKKGIIKFEGTDLDKKVDYMTDFLNSITPTLEYPELLGKLVVCYRNFEEDFNNSSSDLGVLMDTYNRCSEDDISRILGLSNEYEEFLKIKEKYENSQYSEIFDVIDIAFRVVRDLKDEYNNEFNSIYDKFEEKYNSNPLWSEKKFSSETYERAIQKMNELKTEK